MTYVIPFTLIMLGIGNIANSLGLYWLTRRVNREIGKSYREGYHHS